VQSEAVRIGSGPHLAPIPARPAREVSCDRNGFSDYSAATPETIDHKDFMKLCLFAVFMPITQLQHRNPLQGSKLWHYVAMYRLFSCNTLTISGIP